MVSQTSTGPGEGAENLDRRPDEKNETGEQVRYARKFCDDVCKKDASFKTSVLDCIKNGKTQGDKDTLKNQLIKRFQSATEREKEGMGLPKNATESEIRKFIDDTYLFEDFVLYQVDRDKKLAEKAKQELIDQCFAVTDEEYEGYDKSALKQKFEDDVNEDYGNLKSLQSFIRLPKLRKMIIRKISSNARELDMDFMNPEALEKATRIIMNLSPTHPHSHEIKEAWLKLASIADPGSNILDEFRKVAQGEKTAEPSTSHAYKIFFGPENTYIDAALKDKLFSFLMRQYLPFVPLTVLKKISPNTHDALIAPPPEFQTTLQQTETTDVDRRKALLSDREDQWRRRQYELKGIGEDFVSTRKLPKEVQIELFANFGSVAQTQKVHDFYSGQPSSEGYPVGSDQANKDFYGKYKFHPSSVSVKAGLDRKLVAHLGDRLIGIENFQAGNVMEWKKIQKTSTGEKEIIGYYYIDSVPTEKTHDAENIISLRFLGDNQSPLSRAGKTFHYTGAGFFEYVSHCSENGSITFRDERDFGKEMEANETSKKLPRFVDETEMRDEFRRQFPDVLEIPSAERLNEELDIIINPRGDHRKESKSKIDREVYAGMVFAKVNAGGSIDVFQIKAISETSGTITLTDGWGTGKAHEMEMSFADFIMIMKSLKQSSKDIYRLPSAGKKPFGVEEFNALCKNKEQYEDGFATRMGKLSIEQDKKNKGDGVLRYTSGGATIDAEVIKVGKDKDLLIEGIHDGMVSYRIGTFTQTQGTKKAKFEGSGHREMTLPMLWAYCNNHPGFRPTKPEKIEQKVEEKKQPMSWLNVFLHAHTLGVLLHGDIFTAPFKAWHEQHQKDHAFAGKLTAALAFEKLRSGGGPLAKWFGDRDFAAIVESQGNSSFQSYLDELVKMIDDMGSQHRTTLIKRWAKREHFPSPKFMAAMFGALKNFGQLYPYDDGKSYGDGGSGWFWYNSIVHSGGFDESKFPHHMPPKDGKWPKALMSGKEPMSEVEACWVLFDSYKHPILANLGRRYQKYMMAGQKDLENGAEQNLKMRVTEEKKLEWMMNTMCHGKISEGWGVATEMWLSEAYEPEIMLMPYAAALFGHRDYEMTPSLNDHILKQFHEGYSVFMFPFFKSRRTADIFRKTAIAFAYTISETCGDELSSIISMSANQRLSGNLTTQWREKFTSFWMTYGVQLSDKLSGMNDPMLNVMMNDENDEFGGLLEQSVTGDKRRQFEILRDGVKGKDGEKPYIKEYFEHIKEEYKSTDHTRIKRDKGYYVSNLFRYRKSAGGGSPIAWTQWYDYIDANIEDNFANGSSPFNGDGIMNEIKAFLKDIPKLAEKMAAEMGIANEPGAIEKIAKLLYKKNTSEIRTAMEKKLRTENVDVMAKCSGAEAVMMEIAPLNLIKSGGDSTKEQERLGIYYEQMKACLERAKSLEESEGFVKAIEYRKKMGEAWRNIILEQTPTKGLSIEQLYNGEHLSSGVSKIQTKMPRVTGNILTGDIVARKKNFDKIGGEKDGTGGARNNSVLSNQGQNNSTNRELQNEDEFTIPLPS